jgi:hypothetical protein
LGIIFSRSLKVEEQSNKLGGGGHFVEKLSVVQVVMMFPNFYGTLNFICSQNTTPKFNLGPDEST